ncbi:RING-H2 finger protein ATL16-like [Rhodamnia argentea]|uniref:RING-type E3 ubiquitin transferase n=1 Tax=Rhodamnia argentea TaxID=178133 RepID=A0A8B8QA81_9MYRT|nr:RING-H2 finger protein ATL16-like [Rhodamnia argentea]
MLLFLSQHTNREGFLGFFLFGGGDMDLVTKASLIHVSETIPPSASEAATTLAHTPLHNSGTGFPIMAIAIIGILATAFLLLGYYVFVIKCCLNWHRIDLLSRFSLSRRGGRRPEDTLLMYSPAMMEPRGLDDAVIRSIPILQFRSRGGKSRDFGERSFCECAVCLNEFQEDEKLKIIPYCSHVFHIDCIDIWLQNNANCPLCRTSVSSAVAAGLLLPPPRFPPDHIIAPSSTPEETSPYDNGATVGRDEDFVVIELGRPEDAGPEGQSQSQRLRIGRERMQSGGSSSSSLTQAISPSLGKLEKSGLAKKGRARKLHKMTSMGDEFIDIRERDDEFLVQPIRRSISMDSSADRQLFLAVREILRQKREEAVRFSEANDISPQNQEGCSNSSNSSNRVRRTFFSFGHGRVSRSAVQPVCLEP